MSRPSEYATLHHSRRDAGDARSGLLWGADFRIAPLRRSALEHSLLRGEGSGTEVGYPTFVFVRTVMEQFKRTANE